MLHCARREVKNSYRAPLDLFEALGWGVMWSDGSSPRWGFVTAG